MYHFMGITVSSDSMSKAIRFRCMPRCNLVISGMLIVISV